MTNKKPINKNFIKQNKKILYENASIFSKILVLWLNPLFSIRKKELTEDRNIYFNYKIEKIQNFIKPIKNAKKESKIKNNLLMKLILYNYKYKLIFYFFWILVLTFFQIYLGYVVMYLITEFPNFFNIYTELIYYSVFIIILNLLILILDNQLTFLFNKMGIFLKCSINYLIFDKILKYKKNKNNDFSFEDLIKIYKVDANNVKNGFKSIPNFISIIIFIIWGIFFVIMILGWCSSIAFFIIMLYNFINLKLSNLFIKYETNFINKKENTLNFIKKSILDLKYIKLFCLEDFFFKKFKKVKEIELKTLKSLNIEKNFYIIFSSFIPLSFLTILVYNDILKNNTLNIYKIYSSFILFQIWNKKIKLLPKFILRFKNLINSSKKINIFLKSKENNLKDIDYLDVIDDENNVINIENVNFFDNNRFIKLKNINLKIKKNSFIAIIGKKNSGKTSLINSFLGLLDFEKNGKNYLKIFNSIGLINDDIWIRNKSLKENILFGKKFEKKLYNDSLKYSFIIDDLKKLNNFDKIDLNNIKLTKIQKLKILIARIIYSKKEIIIMDDSFNNSDENIYELILKKTIMKFLKNKTRIIVVNNYDLLKNFDRIIILDDGKIIEDNKYEIIKNSVNYKNLININNGGEEKNNKNNNNNDEENFSNFTNKKFFNINSNSLTLKKLDSKKFEFNINNESKIDNDINPFIKNLNIYDNIDKVNYKMIFKYYKFSENKSWILILFIVLILLNISYIYSYYFYNYLGNFTQFNFLIYYTLINFLQVFLIFLKLKIIFYLSIKISYKFNKVLFFKILHSYLFNFVDKIQLHEILKRFSIDSEEIDRFLMINTTSVLFLLGNLILSIVIFSIFSSPSIILFFIILIFLTNYYRKFYNKIFLEIKKLNNLSNFSLEDILNETIFKNLIIKANSYQNYIINEHNALLINNLKYKLLKSSLKSWFLIRIGLLNFIVIIPCFLFVVIFITDFKKNFMGIMVGFLINFIELSIDLSNTINILEEKLISFNKCYLITQINNEKRYKCNSKSLKTDLNKNKKIVVDEGIINLEYLKIKSNNDYIIKDISCRFKGKVGIIGRCEIQKMSIFNSICQFIENSEGNIKIDNIDIKEIDLQNLRKTFNIILKKPFIFEDTIRNNLDPFNLNSNKLIKELIEEFELTEKINKLGGLYVKINYQTNLLSLADKYILNIIRIILNKKKIILIDEKINIFEIKKEEIIEELFKKYFKELTQVILIHNINNILNYDKILILEKGQILEYDSPIELLKNKNSLFFKIYNNQNELKKFLI